MATVELSGTFMRSAVIDLPESEGDDDVPEEEQRDATGFARYLANYMLKGSGAASSDGSAQSCSEYKERMEGIMEKLSEEEPTLNSVSKHDYGRMWYLKKNFHPFGRNVTSGTPSDPILETALLSIVADEEEGDNGDADPLDSQTYRKIAAYIIQHQTDFEYIFRDKESITLEDWEAAWRAVGEMYHEADRRLTHRITGFAIETIPKPSGDAASRLGRASKYVRGMFQDDPVVLPGAYEETATEGAHMMRDRLMNRLYFHLLELERARKAADQMEELKKTLTRLDDSMIFKANEQAHSEVNSISTELLFSYLRGSEKDPTCIKWRRNARKDIAAAQKRVTCVDLDPDELQTMIAELLKAKRDARKDTLPGLDRKILPFNIKGNDKHPPSAKEVSSHIRKGNMGKMVFGVDMAALEEYRNIMLKQHVAMCPKRRDDQKKVKHQCGCHYIVGLDEFLHDVRHVSCSIMSDEAWDRFEERLQYYQRKGYVTSPQFVREVVSVYAIRGSEFIQAYEKATHMVVKATDGKQGACSGVVPFWEDLDHQFNGQIDKKTFFEHCTKSQYGNEEGLAYLHKYIGNRIEGVIHNQQFFLYLLFVALISFYTQAERGISAGYYQNVAIEEAVGLDEIGDKSTHWFPMNFYDTVKEEEFWDWVQGPLLGTIWDEESGKPASTNSLAWTNKVVGGVKIRQFRQSRSRCKGLESLLTQNQNAACNPSGDTRAATNWMPIREDQATQGGPPSASAISRSSATRTSCFDGSPKGTGDFNRTIHMVAPSSDIGLAVSYLIRTLVEEKLNVFVDWEEGLSELQMARDVKDPSKNVQIAGFLDQNTVESEVQSHDNKGTLVNEKRKGVWMNQAMAAACPSCVSSGAVALKSRFRVLRLTEGASNKVTIFTSEPGTDLENRLNRSGLQDTVQVAYDSTERVADFWERVQAAAIKEEPMFFFGEAPHPVITAISAVRLNLEDDYLASSGLKMWQKGLDGTFPDVDELMFKLSLSEEDVKYLMTEVNADGSHAVAACSWLKEGANEWRWKKWLRKAVRDDMAERRTMYYETCYASWEDKPQDRESFYKYSQYLKPGPFDETEPSKPKVVYEITDDGTLTDRVAFEAPSRAEYEKWVSEAEAGNLESEKKWQQAQAWVYRTCSELGGKEGYVKFPGQMVSSKTQSPVWYNCDGYGVFLPVHFTFTEAKHEIDMLKANNWIDIATRAIMVEFFVHNQNSRLLSRMQYVVEISSTGGWVPSRQVNTFRLFQREALPFGAFVFGVLVTILLMLWFLSYAMWCFLKAWRAKYRLIQFEASSAHGQCCPPLLIRGGCKIVGRGVRLIRPFFETLFSDMWFIYDFVMFSLLLVSWGFRLHYMILGTTDFNITCDRVYPAEYETVGDLSLLTVQVEGIAILLVYFKIIYYLRSIQDINRLLQTVERASVLIGYLLLTFLFVMLGFTLSAWIVFGPMLPQYRSTSDSFATLLFMMMGEFDFESMTKSRPGYALVFFLLFYVIVISILFNLLIGVIATTFGEVYEERFQEDTFQARIEHDPRAGSWDVHRAFGLRTMVTENALVRDLYYRFQQMSYLLGCQCIRTSSSVADYHNNNPRIFWPKYRDLLLELDSLDLGLVLKAHSHLRVLAKKYSVGSKVGADSGPRAKPTLRDVIKERVSSKKKLAGQSLASLPHDEVAPESDEDEEEEVEENPYDLVTMSAYDFIEDEVGELRRPAIDFFLVSMPARVMKMNTAKAWANVLQHHKVWKQEVERWAYFGKPSVDEKAKLVLYKASKLNRHINRIWDRVSLENK
eukprot:Sspe_Gene.1383::Locus_463_Transcript_1_1_Confidence_1.000_Length_5419::g.1383::m.1383